MRDYHRHTQRRAIRLTVALVLVVIALAAPLVFLPAVRLTIGQRLGLVPGKDAARLYGAGAPVELVVLTEDVPVNRSLPYQRFTAVYIADRAGGAVVLHDLSRGRDIALPLARYDRIAASADRRNLLFVDEGDRRQPRAVLVDVPTGAVRPLPTGTTDPGLPGDWTTDIAGAAIECEGVSPHDVWVACIRTGRGFSHYLFGDWELQIKRFGGLGSWRRLYRGRGTEPVVGWAADESALYLQNETGIWRVAVSRQQ